MKLGQIESGMVPDKGGRGFSRYPFEKMGEGHRVMVRVTEEDKTDVKGLRKRIREAASGFQRRVGKLKDGQMAKEIVVWIETVMIPDEGPEEVVYIGCRADRMVAKNAECVIEGSQVKAKEEKKQKAKK